MGVGVGVDVRGCYRIDPALHGRLLFLRTCGNRRGMASFPPSIFTRRSCHASVDDIGMTGNDCPTKSHTFPLLVATRLHSLTPALFSNRLSC